MSEELNDIIGPFLERQEARDAEGRKELVQYRKEIALNSKDISRVISAVESLRKDIEALFKLHNDNVSERLKSGKEQWKTVLQGLGVAAVIMAAVLAPLSASIYANKLVIEVMYAEQNNMRVVEAEMRTRQAWAEDIMMLTNDYEQRMSRAWLDDSKGIAYPNRTYTPLKGP